MSRTALVVDDSPSMRQMVTFTLREAGFTTLEGANGQEGLGALAGAAGRVDLIITDLNMPVMDGIAFIRELRRLPGSKFTPILMLTTESQEARKAEGKAAGATGWLVKPFDPDKLLQVVGKVIR
jgi:two-component system, chemotaxis family, chemotaxis protein CheY